MNDDIAPFLSTAYRNTSDKQANKDLKMQFIFPRANTPALPVYFGLSDGRLCGMLRT
jgi:hypothetical protein